MKKFFITSLLAQSLFLPHAKAWRETGHFTVCEIAYRHLNIRAKSKVDRIAGRNFPVQCTWPDMIRKHPDTSYTSSWHFLDRNMDVDFLTEPKLRDSKFQAGDVLQALVRVTQTLKNSSSTPDENKFALRFLGHLVGDIHQPLHIGQEDDGGGNNIQVEWFGQKGFKYIEIQKFEDKIKSEGRNSTDEATGEKVVQIVDKKESSISLHKVWDLHLLDKFIELNALPIRRGYDQYFYKEYASKIDQGQAGAETLKLLQNSTFYDWYMESKFLRTFAYDTGGSKIGSEYYEKSIELANSRILVGGLRLAGELNRILGGDPVPRDLKPDQELLESLIAQAQAVVKSQEFSKAKLAQFADGEKKLKINGITKQLCAEKDLHALYSPKGEKSGRKPAAFFDEYATFQKEHFKKLTGREFSPARCH